MAYKRYALTRIVSEWLASYW